MSSILLVMLVLAVEPVDAVDPLEGATVVASAETPPDDVTKIAISDKRTAAKLREAVHASLKRTAPLVKKDPPAAADELLPLFVELKLDQEMVKEDRDMYTNVVRLRLMKIRDQLLADAKKSNQAAGRGKAASKSVRAAERVELPEEQPSAAGGLGQEDLGKELVDLIQRTIAPDSWDVNGGNGVIMYFEPLHVLVIRQTDEVHEAIGGVVHQLRKAQ